MVSGRHLFDIAQRVERRQPGRRTPPSCGRRRRSSTGSTRRSPRPARSPPARTSRSAVPTSFSRRPSSDWSTRCASARQHEPAARNRAKGCEEMTEEEASPNRPAIVSREEWETAREKLLVKEKEHTCAGDALAAERRRMPWMSVEKDYRFEGPNGAASLADLFEGRRQLVIYRAHYAPEVTTCAPGGFYPERACMGCSMVAYQVAHPAHLNARDTTLAFVSRAPPGRDPGPEGAPRMGAHPLVHDHRRLRRRLRGRPVAWTQRIHPGGGADLPHLLHPQPRGRAPGDDVELPGHDRARTPGGLGGVAGPLSADAERPAGRVVELPRRVRRAGSACRI